MKTYASKKSAVRAARKALEAQNPNFTREDIDALYTIEEHNEQAGMFFWRRIQKEVNARAPESLFENRDIPNSIVAMGEDAIADYVADAENEECGDVLDERLERAVDEAETEDAADEAKQDARAVNSTMDGILRKSAVQNPCKLVWEIASEMYPKGAKRKDIIEHCIAQGVATYTAKTQYQKWYTANKASS